MADQDNTCPLCYDEFPEDKYDRSGPDSVRSACKVWHHRAPKIEDGELQLLRQYKEIDLAKTRLACHYVWVATHRRATSIVDIVKHLITAHEELVEAHRIIGLLKKANGKQREISCKH